MALLGVILIYSLLMGKVEEKTYEYGMLRALGLTNSSLIFIIVNQALFFAIPGIIVGLIISWGLGIGVDYVLKVIATLPPPILMLHYLAIIIPIALGLLVPLVANIIPIRRALSRTLRDSLDVTHQVQNETTVKMIKLEELGLETWEVTNYFINLNFYLDSSCFNFSSCRIYSLLCYTIILYF
jgi:predicted lysophospholipase L1 biosynthesis ABC-type transport system permease subunit